MAKRDWNRVKRKGYSSDSGDMAALRRAALDGKRLARLRVSKAALREQTTYDVAQWLMEGGRIRRW
jgi:hypothetical protein